MSENRLGTAPMGGTRLTQGGSGDVLPPEIFTFEEGLRAGRGEMFNRTIMILEKVLGWRSADFNRIHEMMRMVEQELNGQPRGAASLPFREQK